MAQDTKRERRSRAATRSTEPLPADRLWWIDEAARFFQKSEEWVREHVPPVILPGEKGDRRSVRFRPETCRALARTFEVGGAEDEQPTPHRRTA